jgi:hypothetical protein
MDAELKPPARLWPLWRSRCRTPHADLPHTTGYNILREVLLVADHNAYHIGESAILRQVMGTWAPEYRDASAAAWRGDLVPENRKQCQ